MKTKKLMDSFGPPPPFFLFISGQTFWIQYQTRLFFVEEGERVFVIGWRRSKMAATWTWASPAASAPSPSSPCLTALGWAKGFYCSMMRKLNVPIRWYGFQRRGGCEDSTVLFFLLPSFFFLSLPLFLISSYYYSLFLSHRLQAELLAKPSRLM